MMKIVIQEAMMLRLSRIFGMMRFSASTSSDLTKLKMQMLATKHVIVAVYVDIAY